MKHVRVIERITHERPAHSTHSVFRLALLPLLLFLAGALVGAARADEVNYGEMGTFTQTTPLTVGGITATPGAGQTLAVTNGIGFGILGGDLIGGWDVIGLGESVTFTFDAGPATGVGFRASAGGGLGGVMYLEGFDAAGASLGVVTFRGSVAAAVGLDVSSLFGGALLSGFKIIGQDAGVGCNAWSVTFTTAPPDGTAPTITAVADKTQLWPANGKAVAVKVTGKVTDNVGGSGINPATVNYAVADEYGKNEPAGGITLASDGRYSFTVLLPADRNGNDKDGRTFTITVSAKDKAGNQGSKSVTVTVPLGQAKGK